MRKISIILLWWSRTKELEKMAQECLLSVLENTLYENYEVIIIENKPTVLNESKAVDAVYPSNFLKELNNDKVKVFTQDENLGFVRGNNLGFKLACDNDVLLLNNDTQVPEGWLAPIVAVLDSHDDCAMAMPIQIHKGSSEYFELDGDIPRILEYLKNIIKRSDHVDKSQPMTNGNWLPLCATLINRKAIKKVGDLDENFALGGFEDIDYSWRCLDANAKLYVTSNSAIFHHYGQSFHYHEGYAEVWVDKGKYLMNKHDAKQDSKGNCFRWKDKPEGWKPQ